MVKKNYPVSTTITDRICPKILSRTSFLFDDKVKTKICIEYSHTLKYLKRKENRTFIGSGKRIELYKMNSYLSSSFIYLIFLIDHCIESNTSCIVLIFEMSILNFINLSFPDPFASYRLSIFHERNV
jgi:hypothetical protein